MPDDESGSFQGTDSGTRRQRHEGDDSITVVIDATSDDGRGDVSGLVNVGLERDDNPKSAGHGSVLIDLRDGFGDDDEHEAREGDADLEFGVGATSDDLGELGVDLSPWAPLLGMLDSTEPEGSLGDWPFAPAEGVERAHALELRSESMLQFARARRPARRHARPHRGRFLR